MKNIKFKKKNIFFVTSVSFILFLLLLVLINANTYNLCLTKGQTARFSLCNPTITDRYCSKTVCQFCVSENSPGIYCPASLNMCQDSNCIYLPNQTIIDYPLDITLTSPINLYDTNTNLITFNYKVTNPSYATNCYLYINDINIASNSSKISSTSNNIAKTLNPGDYIWQIECTAKNGTVYSSEERNLIISSNTPVNQTNQTNSLIITLINPSNNSQSTPGVTNFIFSVSNLTNLEQCNLIVNETIKSSINSTSLANQNNFSINLTNGNYVWRVNCVDKSLKIFLSENRILTISDVIPQPNPAPSGGGGGGGGGGGSGGGTICNNKWVCDEWSECKDGVQARVCNYNITKCKPEGSKPIEKRSCEVEVLNETVFTNQTKSPSNPLSNFITGASVALSNPTTMWVSIIVIIVCIIAGYFIVSKKKVEVKEEQN